MQENLGWTELAAHKRAESFAVMRYADTLTDRILLLEGLPNYQRLFHVRVGQGVGEMFTADLELARESVDRLKRGVDVMRAKSDITSANIFEHLLKSHEDHVNYLESQLELLEKLGEALYISTVIRQPEGD